MTDLIEGVHNEHGRQGYHGGRVKLGVVDEEADLNDYLSHKNLL
jgi:hypothetical protein